MPASVLAEGERSDHDESVAAASQAHLVHPEYSSLKRIVPAAAAIAVATVNAAQPAVPRRVDGQEIHRDRDSIAQGMGDGLSP